MNMRTKRNYVRLRRAGWTAENAWRAAKVNEKWEAAGGYTVDGTDSVLVRSREDDAMVRAVILPDIDPDLSWLDADNGPILVDGKWMSSEQYGDMIRARAMTDGVHVVITQYWDGETWQDADSCGGFIGEDWNDSGYDTDMMESALDALSEARTCPTCGRPIKGQEG